MKLKKGLYYVGDPCYIFDKSWQDVLKTTNFFRNNTMIFGEDCLIGNTAYGDGTYFDQLKNKYFVDSGSIGILPISLINIDKKKTWQQIHRSDFMHMHEFTEDFEVSVENGVFKFGNIIINTNQED